MAVYDRARVGECFAQSLVSRRNPRILVPVHDNQSPARQRHIDHVRQGCPGPLLHGQPFAGYVVISRYGKQRRDRGQLIKHGRGADIAGVHDQISACGTQGLRESVGQVPVRVRHQCNPTRR